MIVDDSEEEDMITLYGEVTSTSRSSRPREINPPDTEIVRFCATVAWPRAIKQVLGIKSFYTIEARHERLMSCWVSSRGDNISSQAYDYLTYSLGVCWPRAVAKVTSEDDFWRVRRRYDEITNEWA